MNTRCWLRIVWHIFRGHFMQALRTIANMVPADMFGYRGFHTNDGFLARFGHE
jgi:hypothetical protein